MSGQLPNIPRLYTALAEWSACMTYLAMNPRRYSKGKTAVVCGTALAVQCLELTLTGGWEKNLVWLMAMAGAVALMYLMLWSGCALPPVSVGYLCAKSFLLAEFAASLEWQLYCYFIYQRSLDVPVVRVLLLAAVYAGVFCATMLLERYPAGQWNGREVTGQEFVLAGSIVSVFFLFSNFTYVIQNTPFSSRWVADAFNSRTLVDLAGLAILYAYQMQRRELRANYEVEAIQNILQNQYAQYRQSKESIDIINRKYHDLKHQIAALRAEPDPGRRAAWLDEMEGDIHSYEAQNKTGNPVLDTVLTSKSLVCQKEGINLTRVVDGAKLSFLNAVDICTIFGNALDNAMESVREIHNPEKRLIHVAVSTQKNFLLIRFENYYESDLTFEDDLPVSTKKDMAFHGFGLKSIRYSVQKYGGTMTVSGQNHWFEVKILIPLPEEAV